MEVLGAAGSLLSTLLKAMEMYQQKHMNEEIGSELEKFVRDLQYNISRLQEKNNGSRYSNTSSWALDALLKDLESVDLDAKNILNKGFVKSIWNANKTQSKLETLRQHVMTSFQTRLMFTLLDVAIESQQGQAMFQDAMLNMNKELMELYSSKANQSLKKSMQDVIRKELQVTLNPLMVALQSDGRRDIETTMSMIRNTSAQTSETEKFFEDVLAGLEGALKQSSVSENPVLVRRESKKDGPKWYQDPITWETMCDPVKANDGHTYDRWTILRQPSSMARSPFIRDEKHKFLIERDDISIRSHLFQKFPDQVAKFTAERAAYRNAALQAVNNGNFGESLVMLNHVLAWDPQDAECSNNRDHVQRRLGGGEQGVGDNNSTSTSSSSSVQVPSLGEAKLISQHLNSSGKGNTSHRGNHSFGETDESTVLEMRPERFDKASVDNGKVFLSTDGLIVVYELANGRAAGPATVIANAPCPSHCYPFYFEVLVTPLSHDCEHDVAIGFSIAAGVERGTGLGTYSGSCGYSALQGKVSYLGASGNIESVVGVRYPRENDSAMSHREEGYVVGAGFHTGTGFVFFMLDGKVVALLEATRFGCNHPSEMLFPAVSLQGHGAKVTANFGTPNWFSPEPGIGGFTTAEYNSGQRRTFISRVLDRYRGASSEKGACAVMTKQDVPMRTSVFYFEIIFDISFLRPWISESISLGFATKSTFLKSEQPGGYDSSCGFTFWKDTFGIVRCSRIVQNGKTEDFGINHLYRMKEDGKCRVGVGIHYGTNEIFCTIDGCFLYSVRNRLEYPVNAVLAIGGRKEVLDFCWETSYLNWVGLPTKLQPSLCSSRKRMHYMTTLDPQGLKARHTGFVVNRYNKHDTSQYFGVAAFRADMVAPLQSHAHDTSKKAFYFELIVADKGENGYIAIGFSHFQHFKDYEQLGCYNYSCAYHGDTGKLFTGKGTGKDFGPTFSAGDRVGAGFNHHTNTIFFVKNGEVVGFIHNMMGSCALYPAVGLGSYGEEVHLKFLGFDHPFSQIGGGSPNTGLKASTPILCASGRIALPILD